MRDGPAEVHLDIDDLFVPNGDDLGVPKSMTVGVASLVRDEDALAIRYKVDEFEARNGLAVWPAPAEVRLAIEAMSSEKRPPTRRRISERFGGQPPRGSRAEAGEPGGNRTPNPQIKR